MPKLDSAEIEKINRTNEDKRKSLESTIKSTEVELAAITDPIRDRIMADRKKEFEAEGLCRNR